MLKYRQIMLNSWQQYFTENEVAFILSPTTVLPARPLADSVAEVLLNGQKAPVSTAYLQNTGLSSNVGFAGVSVPAGFTSQGLPVGLEVDTLSGNDLDLLRLILSLETCLQTPLCKKIKYHCLNNCLNHKKPLDLSQPFRRERPPISCCICDF